jgi:DNA-binding transcriptional regulator YhcF (GntR family)
MKKKLPSQKDIPTPIERAVHTAGLKFQKSNRRLAPSWTELAEQVGISVSTVSGAMKGLKLKEMADYDPRVRRSAVFY